MKTLRFLFVLGVVSLLAQLRAQATPLGLTADLPDLGGFDVTVNYNATTKLLTAVGTTQSYFDVNENDIPLFDFGSYTLNATITSAGVLTAGTIAIRGDLDGGGDVDLLLGSLIAGSSGPGGSFGFINPPGISGNYDIMEFTFLVTGGSEAALFGSTGGIILDGNFAGSGTPFVGTWTGNFNSPSTSAVMDTFAITPVPEPSSIIVTSLGLVLALAARGRGTSLGSLFRRN